MQNTYLENQDLRNQIDSLLLVNKLVTDTKYRKACQRYHSFKISTKIELEVLKNASKRDMLPANYTFK